jgi:capsular polysaccharide biosynthesis protein
MIAYRMKNGAKAILRRHWAFFRVAPSRTVLFGARILTKLLPQLFSIQYNRLYPPQNISFAEDWVTTDKSGLSEIRRVDPACTIQLKLPKTIQSSIREQFLDVRNSSWPPTFVVTIPNGRVWGEGFIITPDEKLLTDISTDFGTKNGRSQVQLRWKLDTLAIYDCTVAVLSTNGASLYWHWMFQLLPRFELIKLAGFDIDEIDYFIVSGLQSNFQIETLRILGLSKERLIQSSNVPYLQARRLIAPSVPLAHGCYRPWMVQFLRRSFLGDTDILPHRRVYISRGTARYRRVLNEPSVIRFLCSRGFEILSLETLSVRQQAAAMAECSVIVAPHGGGLSNLVFCSPGTKVIEIFSPELVAGYFWQLCNQLDLCYYYMIGGGGPNAQKSDYPQTWDARADIKVDLKILEKTLEMAHVS